MSNLSHWNVIYSRLVKAASNLDQQKLKMGNSEIVKNQWKLNLLGSKLSNIKNYRAEAQLFKINDS